MVLREEDALAFIPLWLLLLKGVMRASSADIGSSLGLGGKTMIITANFSVLLAVFSFQACSLWV